MATEKAISQMESLLWLQKMPVSISRVQRGIHLALTTTEQDVTTFVTYELRRAKCGPRMHNLLVQVQKITGVQSIKDPETMMEMLDTLTSRSTKQLSKPDVRDMQNLCKRMFVFQRMIEAINERFRLVLNDNLYKYCLSFVEESGGFDLPPVQSYETMIQQTKAAIEEKREHMKGLENVAQLAKLEIEQYIAQHDAVNGALNQWCNHVLDITKSAQLWLMYDYTYPKKLQEYINQLGKRRVSHRQQLQELESRGVRDHNRTLQAEFKKGKADQYMRESRGEKAHYASREKNLVGTRNRIQDLLEEVLATRDRHWQRLNELSGQSVKEFHAAAVNDCEARKVQLERRLSAINQQIHELQQEQARCNKNIDVAKQLLKERTLELDNIVKEMDDLKTMEKNLRNDLGKFAEQVHALQKIREIKLHSDTVRKIYNYGYQPGQYQLVKDEIDEVFKDLAGVIARRWRQVYHRLPFSPPRDYPTRNKDLEQIDISHRRLDVTLDVLAYKALQKWRRLSKTASVEILLNTLRLQRLIGPHTTR